MFLWFIKKFMKNSYKKYLEELDEFNHLKMEIIKIVIITIKLEQHNIIFNVLILQDL